MTAFRSVDPRHRARSTVTTSTARVTDAQFAASLEGIPRRTSPPPPSAFPMATNNCADTGVPDSMDEEDGGNGERDGEKRHH